MRPDPTVRAKVRVLLMFPKFNPHSFWSYDGAREVLRVKYPAAPLGMITLAALLPSSWDIRLVNRNTEDLEDSDLDWADLVMTGGMLAQQHDALALIEMCRSRRLPVVVGGPDVSSSPHLYERADFRVLGEAEGIIGELVAAWERGERRGTFEAVRYKTDVTRSPIPRFDLLKFEQYLYIGVQFSRGCPFTCEFCDIIELYGRNPRAKTSAQMLTELDALYDLGYRGHVDFVDDNLIGNKKAVKAFLPHLIAWQKARNYPFMLTTEASLNLADDPELMTLMRDANFFLVFVGVESPDHDTLVHTSKKQNTKRGIAESIARIYGHGMLIMPGFVLGFDSEKEQAGAGIMALMEAAALPVGIVSLLYALPGTQLTRRLDKEGRLHAGVGFDGDRKQGDFTLAGLNFETKRPREAILRDFIGLLESLYEPEAYFARVRRAVLPMRRIRLPLGVMAREAWQEIDRFFRILWHVTVRRPEMRAPVWRLVVACALRNPKALRNVMVMVVFYLYLPGIARIWIAEAERQLALIEQGQWHPPAAAAAVPVSVAAE
ncbi:MAG: B12-binding domain-containing radical SAM protein [Hyphomicrobiaceae bacterium]